MAYVFADNPIGDYGYFPDSEKWFLRSPERRMAHAVDGNRFEGEE